MALNQQGEANNVDEELLATKDAKKHTMKVLSQTSVIFNLDQLLLWK